MEEIAEGIRRLTLRFPFGVGHVHCYLLRGEEGWTLVDTGIGSPDAGPRWSALAASLPGQLARIVVTHFHPDHVGGAAGAAAATGARVLQGARDYEQCERVWGSPDWSERLADYLVVHGMPPAEAAELRHEAAAYARFIDFARDPGRLDEGDRVDSWNVLELPGHADGHICLLRDGVLVAGDHLLPRITPTVGLYPESRPDPLADYLSSLERTIALSPRLALPAHGEPIADPGARAREIVEHHRRRLAETARALGSEPRTACDVSSSLFGAELSASDRRFAVVEALAHLEHLVAEGAAVRHRAAGRVTYTDS
jgi:glyoxylase-like metal-dependent hydrolase (beta-lactamase superfamily II)